MSRAPRLIRHLVADLDRPETHPLRRRLVGTAVRALDSARKRGEPDDVAWLVDHAEELAGRLLTSKRISEATATTYASRVRTAGTQFLGASPSGARHERSGQTDRGRFALALSRVAPPGSPEEEVTEAMLAIARWPSLAGTLVPALARWIEEQQSGDAQ